MELHYIPKEKLSTAPVSFTYMYALLKTKNYLQTVGREVFSTPHSSNKSIGLFAKNF